MKEISYLKIFIAILLAIVMGCAKEPSPDDKVLATVSNKSITLKDFKNRISKLPSYYQDIVQKNKKRFLDETIVEMLFYEEAIRQGLDRDSEVKDVINEAKKKILRAKLIKNEVEDRIKIDETEVKQFYELHKDNFKSPELWRASHILVATENEARGILDELSKGKSFEELAKLHSTDATASRGGDIGYFRMGQLVPEFENVCTKLNVGQTSDVVRTQFGFHIIRLTDRKEPAVEEFEKVRRQIEEELRRKKRSELFDKVVLDMKERYTVRIEEDAIKSLEKAEETKKEGVK